MPVSDAERRAEPRARKAAAELIRHCYAILAQSWGPQHWWPADSCFEVIVGAFLTQNTAWRNVERALANLRSAGALAVSTIRRMPVEELERLVRPAGYFRQKAKRIKNFIDFLDARYNGSLAEMFASPTAKLRAELLALNGAGPETADSILLYAGNHPVFVVDAYTRRVVERHGILSPGANYEIIRSLFEQALAKPGLLTTVKAATGAPGDLRKLRGAAHLPSRMSAARRAPAAQIYNEMHAYFVGVGKRYCLKSEPHCDGCPLKPLLPERRIVSVSDQDVAHGAGSLSGSRKRQRRGQLTV
jgi:endonuclease-3 related protein